MGKTGYCPCRFLIVLQGCDSPSGLTGQLVNEATFSFIHVVCHKPWPHNSLDSQLAWALTPSFLTESRRLRPGDLCRNCLACSLAYASETRSWQILVLSSVLCAP